MTQEIEKKPGLLRFLGILKPLPPLSTGAPTLDSPGSEGSP